MRIKLGHHQLDIDRAYKNRWRWCTYVGVTPQWLGYKWCYHIGIWFWSYKRC